MDNLNLIDSTFRRVCEIANISGLIIKELQNGCISFRTANEDDEIIYGSWEWENKEQFLLGDQYDVSLFKFAASEYMTHYSCLNHKRYASFIDLCKTLKSCGCIEELILKMDLVGI